MNELIKRDTDVYYISQAEITGAFYTPDRAVAAKSIKKGARVVFERERANKHDALAVAAYDERGNKLGYISRKDNTLPAAFLDEGFELLGEICSVNVKRRCAGLLVRIYVRAGASAVRDIKSRFSQRDDHLL